MNLTVVIHSYNQSRNCTFLAESGRGGEDLAYADRNE